MTDRSTLERWAKALEPFGFVADVEADEAPETVIWAWSYGDRAQYELTVEQCIAAKAAKAEIDAILDQQNQEDSSAQSQPA